VARRRSSSAGDPGAHPAAILGRSVGCCQYGCRGESGDAAGAPTHWLLQKAGRTPWPRSTGIYLGWSVTERAPRGGRAACATTGTVQLASALRLPDAMAFGAWMAIGCRIAQISNASAWWLGDWVVYGQRAYGQRYKAALEATQLDYQTLRNYAWVSRRFETSRRRENLSFQHHAEVAALPEAEQNLWLGRTERLRWSRNEPRRRLRTERRPALTTSDDRPVTIRVQVTTARGRRWRQAAAAAEQTLVEWLAMAMDAAAAAALARDSTAPAAAAPRGDESGAEVTGRAVPPRRAPSAAGS
jgi:hypothetical protein